MRAGAAFVSLGRPAAALLVVAVASGAGCRRAKPPAFERLAATQTSWQRFENESRPAILLRPGEVRRWRLRVEPGTRLVFALGFLEQSPGAGFVHLELTTNGRRLYADRFSAQRKQHWFHRQTTLDTKGEIELAFVARHDATDRAPASNAAWIALTPPRLYRPNPVASRVFLWISQDTLRADHLGAYGYARRTSPVFDALASESVLFEQAMASSSWTLPSLASQFTSRHPSYHGAVLHNLMPQEGAALLFERLAQAGFTVIGITGNDLVSPAHGLAGGFDVLWFDEGRAAWLTERLPAALSEWGGGDLALFIHFMDPHATYEPPPAYRRLFGDPLPTEPDTHWDQLAKIHDPRLVKRVVALYDGEIAYTDSVIGDLLQGLRERGLLERALVAYTADHGEEFLEHGGWYHGGQLYEETLHVPFAIRVPGLAARRIAQPVSLIDFAPTVLDALGLPAPASFQGQSLLPLARGQQSRSDPLLAETHLRRDFESLLALREGSRKFVLLVPPGRQTEFPILKEEMYELDRDPAEQVNRATSPESAHLRKQAVAYLRRSRAEAQAPRLALQDQQTLERLKALGYVQ